GRRRPPAISKTSPSFPASRRSRSSPTTMPTDAGKTRRGSARSDGQKPGARSSRSHPTSPTAILTMWCGHGHESIRSAVHRRHCHDDVHEPRRASNGCDGLGEHGDKASNRYIPGDYVARSSANGGAVQRISGSEQARGEHEPDLAPKDPGPFDVGEFRGPAPE